MNQVNTIDPNTQENILRYHKTVMNKQILKFRLIIFSMVTLPWNSNMSKDKQLLHLRPTLKEICHQMKMRERGLIIFKITQIEVLPTSINTLKYWKIVLQIQIHAFFQVSGHLETNQKSTITLLPQLAQYYPEPHTRAEAWKSTILQTNRRMIAAY